MSFEIDDKLKTSLAIYLILITIIMIQKPKFIFNDEMELKILVLAKNRKYSIPILYLVILGVALISYYLPQL
jgi:hypothetical protein